MASNFKIDIKVNNRRNYESALTAKKAKILKAWGIKWQELVTKIITQKKIVDTGRLRASMDYKVGDSKVTVGTNVTYGKFIELSTSKQPARPFLKPSVMEYKDTYKKIAKSILEE